MSSQLYSAALVPQLVHFYSLFVTHAPDPLIVTGWNSQVLVASGMSGIHEAFGCIASVKLA